MAIWLEDTFTGSPGTDLISGHIGEVGATWAAKSGFGATIDDTGGRIFCNTGAGSKFYPSGAASADDDQVTVYFDVLTAQQLALLLRWTVATDFGYYAIINSANTSLQFYRSTAAGFATVGSAHAVSLNPTGNVVTFKTSGVGSTVALSLNINGTTITDNDTDANRIVVPAKTAIEINGVGSNTTGLHISRVTGNDSAAGSVASITGPVPNSIAPLSSGVTGTSTFALTFTYSGTAPNQWRLVDDGGSTAITGFDWQAFSTAPSAGAGSQSVTGVPKKNGWYNLQIRNSATGTIQATSGKIGAGVHVSINGQSNATNWFAIGDGSLTPGPLVRVFLSGAWQVPGSANMNGAIACGNALAALVQCPVALIAIAVSGVSIDTWVPTTQTNYTDGKNAIIAAGGKIIAEVWVQGESDADVKTQAQYVTAFGTLSAQRRADTGLSSLPYVVATLGKFTNGGHTDAGWKSIDDAFVQISGNANSFLIQRKDLPLADGVHHTASGYTDLGKRAAQAIAYAYGLVAQYRGPSIASVSQVSAGVFDVYLTHHLGSDFTPTSAITGCRFTDPGAGNAVIAVSTAVRQSTFVIRCSLASAPVSLPNLSYLYGMAPVVTGVVLDNSALALPLEYLANIAASAAPPQFATTVTFTVVDENGTAVTGLSNLDYAFFDQVRIKDLLAPVKVGANLAISGGTGTFSIAGVTALAPGGSGYLRWGDSAGVKSGGGTVVVS